MSGFVGTIFVNKCELTFMVFSDKWCSH